MEKPDRRDIEIEQLKRKIERYQQALTSLKKGNATSDIHLKRRLSKVETNVEHIHERVNEMSGLLEEGLSILSQRVKTLDDKNRDLILQQHKSSGKDLYNSSQMQHQQPDNLHTLGNKETQSLTQNTSVPSFQLLQRMAKPERIDTTPTSIDLRNLPPSHANSSSIKAIMTGKKIQPLDEIEQLSNPQQGEVIENRNVVQPSKFTKEKTVVSDKQYSDSTGQVKEESFERILNSSLWNVFKRK